MTTEALTRRPLLIVTILAMLAQLADLWTTSLFSMLEHEGNPMARYLLDRVGVEEREVWLLTVLGKSTLALLMVWAWRCWNRLAARQGQGLLSAALVDGFLPRSDQGLGANAWRLARALSAWHRPQAHHVLAGVAVGLLSVGFACWHAALNNVLMVRDAASPLFLFVTSEGLRWTFTLLSCVLVLACALKQDLTVLRQDRSDGRVGAASAGEAA